MTTKIHSTVKAHFGGCISPKLIHWWQFFIMKVTETHSNQRVLERTNSYSDYAWLPSNAKPSHCSKSAGPWAPCFAEGLCHFKSPFCSESLHPGSTASLREAINLAVCFIFVLCLCPVTPGGSCSYPVFREGVLQLRRLWAHWPCWVPSPNELLLYHILDPTIFLHSCTIVIQHRHKIFHSRQRVLRPSCLYNSISSLVHLFIWQVFIVHLLCALSIFGAGPEWVLVWTTFLDMLPVEAT